MEISPACAEPVGPAGLLSLILAAVRALTWWGKHALVVVLVLLVPATSYAQKPTQYEVEAAYLFNFAKFVRWPPHSSGNFEICILGTDPFGSAMDRLIRGEDINGEQLTIRRIHAVPEAFSCRIVFLGSSESRHLDQDVSLLATHPILTVSDIDDFADHGGEIQFVNDAGRVRFVINRAAAEKCGLGLSSELLKVAKLVLPANGLERP
jgi:YfiR/HmsC-like